MKKIKSILTLGLGVAFLSAMTLTSCGGKKEESKEETTEQTSEHPEDGAEHPAESEHPADSTGGGSEHPDNN